MKKLIPIEERESELLSFGAPKSFIENIGKIPELKFRVEKVDGAYFYFPTISNYQILSGLNIIPIFDEGETFRVFGYNESVKKIFHFELENDQIYTEYGTNWNLLLFDIMFQYFEDDIDEKLNLETFKKVGDKIGFDKSESLYELIDIPLEEYNEKYEELEKWKKEIAEKLKIL
ncbi:hypothetical protein [uncultured Tenacibaculum sp.]|uniref:hypothetical protein n=1 Tax=uncultured Tenacibaculum sp. TaxID=174713 RepID=UPI002601EB35|nr:hypothetical protein [uncultured Tenacibaculum sp.]